MSKIASMVSEGQELSLIKDAINEDDTLTDMVKFSRYWEVFAHYDFVDLALQHPGRLETLEFFLDFQEDEWRYHGDREPGESGPLGELLTRAMEYKNLPALRYIVDKFDVSCQRLLDILSSMYGEKAAARRLEAGKTASRDRKVILDFFSGNGDLPVGSMGLLRSVIKELNIDAASVGSALDRLGSSTPSAVPTPPVEIQEFVEEMFFSKSTKTYMTLEGVEAVRALKRPRV